LIPGSAVDTYSPLIVPVSWQSERVADNAQRFALLCSCLEGVTGISVHPCEWPMGYGSLAHDLLPVFYQPVCVMEITGLAAREDVEHCALYVYDDCLAVLHLRLRVAAEPAQLDDLAITRHVEALCEEEMRPVLRQVYRLPARPPLVAPGDYRLFTFDEADLTAGRPLWVARMLTAADGHSEERYSGWLQNVEEETEYLLLGSGNSLLRDRRYFSDVHRMMVFSQFRAALVNRIENLLEENLGLFNASYYDKRVEASLYASLRAHQFRNDHIEFLEIQYSSARTGVQGPRRRILRQIDSAWETDEQGERIGRLAGLVQTRLDRMLNNKLRRQNRAIQTLLGFLAALGLSSLMVDLVGIQGDIQHASTVGSLDVFSYVAAENVLNLTFLVVILTTLYFYRSHE
jgi:hypothetical protein